MRLMDGIFSEIKDTLLSRSQVLQAKFICRSEMTLIKINDTPSQPQLTLGCDCVHKNCYLNNGSKNG